jgi:signal transduction histidine kinase
VSRLREQRRAQVRQRREGRILMLRLLPWLLLIGLIGALSYLRLLDLRLSPLRAQARTLLEQGIALSTAELTELSRSALVLGQTPAIGLAAATGDTQAMAAALLAHARASPRHAEISWIDEHGQERVRTEHRDGMALLAPPAGLRSPGQMPWLTHFNDLLPAEARFMPLERESGRHTLRAASPVYEPSGRLRGMVVIRHDLQAMIARLARLEHPSLAPLRLYDSTGSIVSATEPTPLATQDPALWQAMRQHSRGRRETSAGMWYFQDFLPAEPGPGRLAAQPWFFVAHVPQDSVQPLRETSAWQCLMGCLMAFGLAVMMVKRQRRTECEREQLLADLQANHRALAEAKAGAEDSLGRLRQLQDELVQAEKLASLGLLVAGVAHELNTPLGSARMTASTLMRRLGEGQRELGPGPPSPAVARLLERQRAGLEIIEHSLDRASRVIRLFKQLAVDRGAVERRRFELDEVLQDVRRLLVPRLGSEAPARPVPVSLHIAPGSGIVLDSYPGPLGQVIENLIANALIHAFDPPPAGLEHGSVRVLCQILPGGDELELEVTDDGCGIEPQVLPRIFDPFFTTRRGRGGTGIGLHLCHHFCTQVLGGRLQVDSHPGQGSRFSVRIPLQAP